jgi:hypothetical protein
VDWTADPDPDPERTQRLVSIVTLDCWRALLRCDGLTLAGMARIREALIDPQPYGLVPSAHLSLLKLDIDEAVADGMGVPADELPGNTPVPDDLGGWPAPPV